MASNVALLVARILLGIMFVLAGFSKLRNISGTAAYYAGFDLPFPTFLAWATGLFELLAGICVIAGFLTVIACVLLALFAVAAGTIGHYGQGGDDRVLALMHMQAFMKDLGLAGGFLALAVAGPGRFSLDKLRSPDRRDALELRR